MYVCVCNGLTDRDIRRVIDERRLTRADEVYAALHCAPQCGTCFEMLEEMLGGVAAACCCAAGR